MKLYIGEDPKTGKMDTIEVHVVPCPDAANPYAVQLVDDKDRVWGWYKYAPDKCVPPHKGERIVPMKVTA